MSAQDALCVIVICLACLKFDPQEMPPSKETLLIWNSVERNLPIQPLIVVAQSHFAGWVSIDLGTDCLDFVEESFAAMRRKEIRSQSQSGVQPRTAKRLLQHTVKKSNRFWCGISRKQNLHFNGQVHPLLWSWSAFAVKQSTCRVSKGSKCTKHACVCTWPGDALFHCKYEGVFKRDRCSWVAWVEFLF